MAKLALIGGNGRLGNAIQALLKDSPSKLDFPLKLETVIDRENAADFSKSIANIDIILDVSNPVASEVFLEDLIKKKSKIPYVIGCTGWTDSQMKSVRGYAEQACVVFAPNFSPGVNLFLELLEKVAPAIRKWGYDVIVHETHHTRKIDSPSGTAKAMVESLNNPKVQIHSSRAGDIVGTHEVRLVGRHEILTLSHEALDRSVFAQGALLAAQWAFRQKNTGLKSMKEVIFEKSS